jgi:hypothetical protein
METMREKREKKKVKRVRKKVGNSGLAKDGTERPSEDQRHGSSASGTVRSTRLAPSDQDA